MFDLQKRLFQELDQLTLIDPHTHINALDPASHNLADILGYHYYTELAHSSGLPVADIESDEIDEEEKVRRLVGMFSSIDNTVQYSWFLEIVNSIFDFECDRIDEDNWISLYDHCSRKMADENWADFVLQKSKLEALFLTNDFDDPLEGFDTTKYIPCLRTDDLVFHLCKKSVQDRLASATHVEISGEQSLNSAIGALFTHFVSKGAKACAISLPPDFSPTRVSANRAQTAIEDIYSNHENASETNKRAVANFVFWTLAEYCDQTGLPFDLMIGVNRSVYPTGVFQGMDLYDSRVSLIQYAELFNAFPNVTFPISVLASVTNQELVSYAWIFPNVVANGHWWYSNTPSVIERDAAHRMEAIPRTKQVGYYSDMYKLEFALPKFGMYKRILAKVLAEEYVIQRKWSEEKAIDFGKQILRGNVESIFMNREITAPSALAAMDGISNSDADSESDTDQPSDAEIVDDGDDVLEINLD